MTEEQEHNSLERSMGKIEGQMSSLISVVSTLSADIKSLSNDFSTMEKGRLTKAEVNIATMAEVISNLRDELSQKTKNSAMLYGGIISIGVSIISALVIYSLIQR